VHFYVQTPEGQGRSAWYPVHEFLEYREQNDVFTHLLGGASMEVLYDLDGATYRVRGAIIDPQALGSLGVRTTLGRAPTDADGAAAAPPTFLMSDRMWNERFNRDPDIVGRTLNLNGTMRTLIGVLPPRYAMHNADVFFPTTIGPGATNALIGGAGNAPLQVWTYGRLKDGITPEQAAANMEVLARNQARLYPQRYPEGFRIAVVSLADAYTAASIKELVYILVGAVLMLVMIACSNVANLLLARATARESELALRAGLGSSRARLMQLMLAESFVLAVTGTIVGGALAYAGLQWVRATIPADTLPAEVTIRFSGEALLATVGLTMFTTVLCGLVPAFRASRGDLHNRLTSSGKGVGLRPGRGALRTMLVAVQVTLAIVLLVGAGLMMRTFIALQQLEPGVNTENVFIGRFAFPQNQRRTPDEMKLFVQRVVQGVSTLPGVEAVTPSLSVPVLPGPQSPVAIPGTTPAAEWRAMIEFVGDGYFRTVGLPLVRGRLFSEVDIDGTRPVLVVNDRFVQAFLDGADPIGRTVSFAILGRGADAPPPLFEIVGVVADARNSGLQEDVRPQAFLPYTTPGVQPTTIMVRTTTEPLSIEHSVRQQIWAVDRGVALMNVMTLEALLDRDSFAAPRFGVGLMATFAVVGLILAAIGVFSVMAYTVSLQTHDIGIRMAHGAEPQGVVRMIVWRGLRPIVVGVVLGLGASWWLSRVMANQIYGVATTDPWTFAGVATVLTVVAVAACVIPARRATRVNPLVALRER
jgi:putative ABC transport system permease protein